MRGLPFFLPFSPFRNISTRTCQLITAACLSTNSWRSSNAAVHAAASGESRTASEPACRAQAARVCRSFRRASEQGRPVVR